MGFYTADQWVLFFFFYCLCGWIWESCYVSVRQHHWVNRGFLHGPLLPIYGSGAIIILLSTIRVHDHPALICLFGMIAATVLEYFTGAAMEALFKVRYWDYTSQKLNLNGYICLSSTLAWGVFSLLLVKVIHPPIAVVLLKIPAAWAEPLAFVLVGAATVDAVQSFHAAMDLREVLAKLAEENEDLRRLAKRAEVVSAFAKEDLRMFRDRTEVEKLLLQSRMEMEHAQRQEARSRRVLKRRERLEDALRRSTGAKLEALRNISEALESCAVRLEDAKGQAGEAFAARRAEITDTVEKVHARETAIRSRTSKFYKRSLRILRGNPTASAKKYAEEMENLRRLDGMHHD